MCKGSWLKTDIKIHVGGTLSLICTDVSYAMFMDAETDYGVNHKQAYVKSKGDWD
jgi:hypothetical protein